MENNRQMRLEVIEELNECLAADFTKGKPKNERGLKKEKKREGRV